MLSYLKQRDRTLCSDCTGIVLLNVTYKVFPSYPEKVTRNSGTQCTIKWDSDQVNPLWKT